jgi:hypothetical protein
VHRLPAVHPLAEVVDRAWPMLFQRVGRWCPRQEPDQSSAGLSGLATGYS